MKSLDLIKQERSAILQSIQQAISGGDEAGYLSGMERLVASVESSVRGEFEELCNVTDTTVLAQRGIRQLTGAEKEFYQKFTEAARAKNYKQALENLDVTLPETVINSVFDDLEKQHPLLEMIDFQNAGAVTKWLLANNPAQLASWGNLTDEIKKELTSSFKMISLEQNKLSAFIFVCEAMLDLGPEWLDRYVRTIMYEALAYGLEDGMINGRGVNSKLFEPIGMRKNLNSAIDPDNGYADKDKVVVEDLDAVTYGTLLSKLAEDENGNQRKLSELALIVSPKDYFAKVFPATTIRGMDGTYRTDILPYPTRVIQSCALKEGEAILGLPKEYLMALGTGKDGKIEYSDDYKFLEDMRTYKIKLYGNGQAKDNNAFLLLDISALKAANLKVEVVEVGTTNP